MNTRVCFLIGWIALGIVLELFPLGIAFGQLGTGIPAQLPSTDPVPQIAALPRPVDGAPFDAPAMQPFAPGVLLAVVNEEHVLAGDLLAYIEPKLREAQGRVTPKQLEELRERFMRQMLPQVIQTKMLAQYFVNEQVIGKPLHERLDARRQIDKRVTEAFYENMVPQMMESQKVDTPAELDRMLREEGSSLDLQKQLFKDSMFAREAMNKHVPKKFDVDALTMRDYYEAHLDDFRRPARARFRELTALFSKCRDRQEAEQLIRQMGETVLFGGTNFEAVAKKLSQGTRASQGGVYDWVTQGSLKNENLDAAIFAYELNRLSPIIEDHDGLRIIEVLEREPARILSFEDAQIEIREILSKQRAAKAKETLVEKLRANTTIWSLWPDDIPGARPLSELIVER